MEHVTVEPLEIQGLCADVLSALLSEKAIILNQHGEQIFFRPGISLQIRFKDGPNGREMDVVFRDQLKSEEGEEAEYLPKPIDFEWGFFLHGICDDNLIERIFWIATEEKESFVISLEQIEGYSTLVHLVFSFGDFRTQSVCAAPKSALAEFLELNSLA
jgi:hypothetical protein